MDIAKEQIQVLPPLDPFALALDAKSRWIAFGKVLVYGFFASLITVFWSALAWALPLHIYNEQIVIYEIAGLQLPY